MSIFKRRRRKTEDSSQLDPLSYEDALAFYEAHKDDDPWTVPIETLARMTQAAMIVARGPE